MGRLLDLTYTHWFNGGQVSEPYKAYMPHTINGWTPSLDAATIKRLHDAAEHIRDLQRIPADRTLQWCLNRAEAIASSHVEGIVTTMRSLSLLESQPRSSDPGRVERDRQALGAARLNAHAAAVGARRTEPITSDDLREMHRRLFNATQQQIGSGEYRDEQNWVGPSGARTPAAAVYVPPPHQTLMPLLEDLTRYASGPQLVQPLMKAAMCHLQFESIHPFVDGNGRTGRALLHCVLQRDMPHQLPLPLSAAITERRQDYYASLRPYQTYIGPRDSDDRAAAAAASVAYIAVAADVACDYTRAVAAVLADMQQRWTDLRLRPHSAAAAVLHAMSTMPAADTTFLATTTGRSPRAVRRATRQLTDRGVIAESVDEDTARTVFELPEMLEIVDWRQRLVNACWELRSKGTSPKIEAVISHWRMSLPQQPAKQQLPPCTHIGVRTGTQCKRRSGHNPPHRYT